MSYHTYKVLHYIGIFFVLVSLGGMTLHMINGGTRNFANRKWVGMIHGIGVTLVFVAGFGLMARLGIMSSWPTWIIGKLAVWLVLAALPAVIYRATGLAKTLFVLIPLLAAIAGYLALTKPGSASATTTVSPAEQTAPAPAATPAGVQ